MKKEDLPQDDSPLDYMSRELYYVKDEDGNYTTGLSKGWKVKKEALDATWEAINERVEEARQAVLNGEKSPIHYYMELNIMDLSVLSGYTGFWKWTIKRHLKPERFRKLSDKKLERYAKAFEVSLEELKNFEGAD